MRILPVHQISHKVSKSMQLDDKDISILRPALTAAPVLVCVLVLYISGILGLPGAVALVVATVLGVFWLVVRYRTDIITERRRARIRAERSPQRNGAPALLRNIVNGITDPLILLDTRRKVVQANNAALALLGDNIVGRDISFYLRHPAALKAIELALADGKPSEHEISLMNPVERNYLMRVNQINAPDLEDHSQQEIFLILSIYDITRIKLAEKMRVDFVANASHELRTPLASVLGFVETLQGPASEDREARQRFLAIMAEEAARMKRLIEDLLSLSRIEMNQDATPEDLVNLKLLLKGLVDTTDLRVAGTREAVRFDVPENLPLVRGDRDQLVQVFQNLFDNAIKYGRAGEAITVRATLCSHIPGRKEAGVAISVFNRGEGIPAEHIPRLTERFYRVDTARSRKLGGTGLGLAIVKHIVQRHRGALNIESEQGVGTTVTVYLPLALNNAAGSNDDAVALTEAQPPAH